MADFLLDLRPSSQRAETSRSSVKAFDWYPEHGISVIEGLSFSLISAQDDSKGLWAPAIKEGKGGRIIVALAGRVALEKGDWHVGEGIEGAEGGLACRAIMAMFERDGVEALTELSGNFAIVVIDETASRFSLITDRGGVLLCFRIRSGNRLGVVGTHPDVVAAVAGCQDNLDLDSLGEFLASGRTSFPHTYYVDVETLQWATLYKQSLSPRDSSSMTQYRYFDASEYQYDGESLEMLADEFADVFHRAVRLRTQAVLGKTAVGMSGGADSRSVLSCVSPDCEVQSLTLMDGDNLEAQTAASVSGALAVPHENVTRGFDFYGRSAVWGARIGGGAGCLASNHFIGAKDWFSDKEIRNFITGCYCDYLFKGLASNTRESRCLRKERFADLDTEFYRPVYRSVASMRSGVAQRLDSLTNAFGTHELSDETLYQIECKRIFPMASEADSAQRTIAQRVLHWFPPMADKEVLRLFCKIPPSLKLNGVLFQELLARVCPPEVLAIRNSNTGGPMIEGRVGHAYHRFASALRNRLERTKSTSMMTAGSWPNWKYYLRKSELLRTQWGNAGDESLGVLKEIVNSSLLEMPPEAFPEDQIELFLRIWTIKLWLESRAVG